MHQICRIGISSTYSNYLHVLFIQFQNLDEPVESWFWPPYILKGAEEENQEGEEEEEEECEFEVCVDWRIKLGKTVRQIHHGDLLLSLNPLLSLQWIIL